MTSNCEITETISSQNTAKLQEEDTKKGLVLSKNLVKNKKYAIPFIIIALISLHVISIANVVIVNNHQNNEGKHFLRKIRKCKLILRKTILFWVFYFLIKLFQYQQRNNYPLQHYHLLQPHRKLLQPQKKQLHP